MSNSMEQDPRIADELGKYRLAPPSLDLQKRIIRVARQSMESREPEPDDIPWKLPAFRFAASLVIAVLIIFAGTLEGDYVITQWQDSPASLYRPTPVTASIAGLGEAPLSVELVVSDPARSREQFLNYQRQLQEWLSFSQ